jgi:hypothetical protein
LQSAKRVNQINDGNGWENLTNFDFKIFFGKFKFLQKFLHEKFYKKKF